MSEQSPHEARVERIIRAALRDAPYPESREARQARLFHSLKQDLLDAIDEFGYEAVYFGVGCEVFPDAVNPWEGNDY
jgi:hypothetical protein